MGVTEEPRPMGPRYGLVAKYSPSASMNVLLVMVCKKSPAVLETFEDTLPQKTGMTRTFGSTSPP
jgi:hypothetical protein